MNVHWILEATNYQNDNNVAQRLMYLLAEKGHPVTMFDYVPFEGTDYSFLPKPEEGPAVYFGTWNALMDMRERVPNLPRPFAWCDLDKLNCSTYYKHLEDYILQQDRWSGTLEMLPLIAPELYEAISVGGKVFIRPDDNEKSFPGALVREEELEPWLRNVLEYRMVPQSTVFHAARPRAIDAEWRFVLVEGKVVGGSQYKTNGHADIEPGYDPLAATFAEEAATVWTPHPVFVMDVGLVEGDYKIVEVGPFNYAGLYKTELGPVVDAINKHVEKEALR